MARSEADYLNLLQGLLPLGAAWPRDPESVLTKLLSAFAVELARLDQRADDLLEEADPRTTFELLTDWERVAGLPDTCTGEADTLEQRRQELLQRLTGLGGQSRQFFIDLAERLGYPGVTIEEFQPFVCGVSELGVDPLNGGDEVRFNWKVVIPAGRVTSFTLGESRCGDSLTDIDRAADLECLLTLLQPAPGTLIFSYEGV